MPLVKVADVAAVPPGRVVTVEVEGRKVALCNVEGTICAVDNVCTHDGEPLDQSKLFGREIECPRHGARFDACTGRVRRLPAVLPLDTFPVTIEDSAVLLDTDDLD